MEQELTSASFEQSLRTSWDRLRTYANRLTGSWHEAEDLIQEAITRAYTAWPTFRGDASFATWVRKIMTNVYRDHLKRNARLRFVSINDDLRGFPQWESELVADTGEMERGLELQDLRAAIECAFARLPNAYRKMIVLKYVKHLSYEELAQAFECSIESVRCKLYRARRELRKLLQEFPDVGIAKG